MSQPFPVAPTGIPYITTAQMREVDRAMIDDFGITLLQMMENAGRNLADVVIHTVLDGEPHGRRVVVAAGPGGNGGGGLVAARHLHNRGCEVSVVLAAQEDRVSDAVRHQLTILQKSGVMIESGEQSETGEISKSLDEADVVIDALFGYSLNKSPRGAAASMVRVMNESTTPVVSNDIPSGIDATTGTIYEPAVRATATLTIALPKTGLRSSRARQLAGDLYLGDIAVPPELYEAALGMPAPKLFTTSHIVKIPGPD
ncbi:MAG: NAD(P)H-hydrate epimerase [Chloroflexi bacterium]|nr:NAD(P)H-hydrate epimerase [Chloroflexota bacterium]